MKKPILIKNVDVKITEKFRALTRKKRVNNPKFTQADMFKELVELSTGKK